MRGNHPRQTLSGLSVFGSDKPCPTGKTSMLWQWGNLRFHMARMKGTGLVAEKVERINMLLRSK
jgi:hypothetical protein